MSEFSEKDDWSRLVVGQSRDKPNLSPEQLVREYLKGVYLALLSILILSASVLNATPQDPIDSDDRGLATIKEKPSNSSSSYARRHALVIGIDDYENPAFPDLGYAVHDAQAVSKILIDRFDFNPDDVKLIINKDATKNGFEQALVDWTCESKRIGEEDLLIVFFAGHGVTRDLKYRGKRGYLVAMDSYANSNREPIWSSLIGMNFLENVSETVPAKHALFILDCCFGGLAVTRSQLPITAGLANRARQVITAGNADQSVLDTGGGGHSVFTGSLLGALQGNADIDNDNVITFGELFNYIGREVESKTDGRQTPLQATFADHEGGNVALFPKGVNPRRPTIADRLNFLERTAEEQLEEIKRLSDALLIQDLKIEAENLWPQIPEMVPHYRTWLVHANDVLSRRVLHEKSVRLVKQEAYLSQILAGLINENEATEPIWEKVEPQLRWRFAIFSKLVTGLNELESLIKEIEERKEVASTLWQKSIGDHKDLWDEICTWVAEDPLYGGLELVPQIGMVPIGWDPQTSLVEFSHLLTGEVPKRKWNSKIKLTKDTGLVFVLIPGGTFPMGAIPPTDNNPFGNPNVDPEAEIDEAPVHTVNIPAFFLSKYEMTQEQWKRITGSNPSIYRPTVGEDDNKTSINHPVENVSWYDCRQVLSKLNLRLPSEAEWEYATRAGNTRIWWTGNEKESLRGAINFADLHCRNNGGPTGWVYEVWLDDGFVVHAPVGSFLPNTFGLYDVHGNVWEWCQDSYGSFIDTPIDGLAYENSKSSTRVYRGGSWSDVSQLCRSASRGSVVPDVHDGNLGIRPATSLQVDDKK